MANFDGHRIVIECKRPQSLKRIRSNVKDAHGQIKKRVGITKRQADYGIIAIDITKLTNPEFKLYAQNNYALIHYGLTKIVDNFIMEHQHKWQTKRMPRVLGVLLRLCVMGVDESRDNTLVFCQEIGLNPLNSSSMREQSLAERLTKRLSGMA